MPPPIRGRSERAVRQPSGPLFANSLASGVLSCQVGRSMRSLTSDVNSMRALGEVYVGSPKRNVESVEVDGDRAHVLDCVDISKWLLAPEATRVAIPDQIVQDEPGLWEFTLALRDGAWFVTLSQQVGSCTL